MAVLVGRTSVIRSLLPSFFSYNPTETVFQCGEIKPNENNSYLTPMASPDLEERILDTIRTYNERNEPIGKKAIYQMKFAAITTVQKAIKSLEADGKITEHMVTLPRGTYCMLMIRPEGQPEDDVIRQHIADMTLFQARKNGETLDKILKIMEESRNAQNNL